MKITAAIISEFEARLILEEKSAATVEKYVRDVRAFARFSGGEVTRETVLAYKRQLQSRYAASSVNSMLAALNALFARLDRRDLRVKALKLQRQLFRSEDSQLTKAEYVRLCRAADQRRSERLSLLLQTLCGTGIRVGELRFITVEAVRRGEVEFGFKGKTRTVFIVGSLKKKLLAYAKKSGICSGAVFVTRSGRPIGRTAVWREMKSLCRLAGVAERKVFPHNLRRLFARVFYELEKDIAKLADILGHSSVNTTRIYIATTGTEHRKKLERMRLIL